MSNNGKWTKGEMDYLFEARHLTCLSYKDVAVELHRTESACEHKYRDTNWEGLGYYEKYKNDIENEKVIEVAIRDKIAKAQDRRVRRYKIAGEIIADRIIKSVKRLPEIKPPKPSKRKISKKHESEEIGVMLSDFHLGHEHSLEETGGISEYNEKVLSNRINNFKQAVIDIANLHSDLYDIPVLNIFCLGDIVAGMNDVGQWSNTFINLPIYDQMSHGWRYLEDMIYTWLGHFEKVRFFGVRGNHGRGSPIGTEKDYVNWDYVSYKFLEARLESNKRIEFVIPQTWWIMTEIKNHKFLLVHGDDIKGKTMPLKSLLDFEQKMAGIIKTYPDYTLCAHFHSAAELTSNSGRILINGAFIGPDVYALKDCHKSSLAEQKVFGIHSKHGITWTYNINLDHTRT